MDNLMKLWRPAKAGMKTEQLVKKVVSYGLIVLLLLVILIPLVWVISISFQTGDQLRIRIPIQWIPNPVTLQNYIDGFNAEPWLFYLRNNLIWGAGSLVGLLISTTLVAYAFARMNFRGKNFLFMINILLMLLPDQVTMVPKFIMFARLGWIGTFLPVIVPAFFAYAPSHTFMLTQFFRTIPRDLSEAARIDGASEFQILWHIILPLSKPIMAVVVVFHLTWIWSDYLTPLIYLSSPKTEPIVLGLQDFIGIRGQIGWGPLMAMSFLTAIPVVVLYFFVQRYFAESFVLSGMKG